jgi:hypothetical protein
LITKESLGLTVQSLILDKENSMLVIPGFKDKDSAVDFNKLVEKMNPASSISKPGKFENVVITNDNLNILYDTKEIDTYMKFYRKNYQIDN